MAGEKGSCATEKKANALVAAAVAEAVKPGDVAAAVAEAAVNPADVVAPIAVSDGEKPAGSIDEEVSDREKPAADSSDGEDDVPTINVMAPAMVDYILSWDYAERKPFKSLLLEDDDDDGFITAEDRERFAKFDKYTDGLIEFQQKVREEFEAKGYVEVADDYEERIAHSQALSDAAFLKAFGEEEIVEEDA